MEELLTDWRFLALIGGIILAVGEARVRIHRHESILSTEKQAEYYTMIAELREASEDINELRTNLSLLSEKYDRGTARLWSSLEESKERVAKLEGRMNGAV